MSKHATLNGESLFYDDTMNGTVSVVDPNRILTNRFLLKKNGAFFGREFIFFVLF